MGLDVGTSSCKAAVMDGNGAVLSQSFREYQLLSPRPGWFEMNPHAVWDACKQAITAAAQRSERSIDALAAASFGEAAVLLDKIGEPRRDSIFFTDIRGNEFVSELDDRLGVSAVTQWTGMPVNGMYTLPKLLWLARHSPEVLDKTAVMLPFGGYVNYMLTGRAVTDPSLASRTLMFNRHTMTWDDRLFKLAGISGDILPDVIPAGQAVGEMLPDVAAELGFKNRPLVVSGCHDQVAAAIGAGVMTANSAVDGVGSAECITVMLPSDADTARLHRHNICAEPYAIEGTYVSLAFNNTGGSASRWYLDTFKEGLKEHSMVKGINAFDALNAQISENPSPLLFLPYLSGSGTPHMDANAVGALLGLTVNTTGADIYRALVEGLCFEMRYNLDLLRQSGVDPPELAVSGGGVAEALLHIKAGILKIPLYTLSNPQSGNTGLAMLCAVALREFGSLGQASEAMVRRKRIFEPKRQNSGLYDEHYEQYKRMYQCTKAVLHG
jgi:xylulokinase